MAVLPDYEQTREQRIKENRERLQKLGIVDLSLQLKLTSSRRTTPKSPYQRRTPLKSPSLGPPEPHRRSSRLQNVPPVQYVEPKEVKPGRSRDIVLDEGSRPEFYTEEHEKLLGSTELPWTFAVDGYAADGTRIYDPVNGKTCHQCRQKTLGQRTSCIQCNLVQGQFCGDCLYSRYGEHVVEANQNPNWICPPCRGICNCSLCRHAKGWAPTGMLYRRVNDLGYKSVAHYLIATKRAPPQENTIPDKEQSAKRCLPFEDMQLPTDNASDDIAADENNATHHAEANQTPIESVINVKVAGDVHVKKNSGVVGRPRKRSKKENPNTVEEPLNMDVSASDNKIADENNTIADTEPNQIPEESVINGELANGEVVHVKKRPVGRPRKSSMKDNLNTGAESFSRNVQENGLQQSTSVTEDASDNKASYESNADPDTKADQTPEESVVNGEVVEDVLVHVKRPRGRPRKESKKENLDTSKEPLSTDVNKRPRGRPRKKPVEENIEADEGPFSKDIKKNGLPNSTNVAEDASDNKPTDESDVNQDTSPNQTPEETVVNGEVAEDVHVHPKKRPIGRPGKGSKKESLDMGKEPLSTAVKTNESVSEMQSPHSSSTGTDSVARRLRSRNET